MITQTFLRTARDGGYGHGCNNDAFSVFGFLAFLLAAANLFMAEERRKKRSVTVSPICEVNLEGKQQAMMSSYTMLRGFLNAMDAQNIGMCPMCLAWE